MAAEASKKIIENDLGKQFAILGSNIADSSRAFIDLFIPATLSATKALNSLFGTDVSGDVDKKILNVRFRIQELNKEFERGQTSQSNYSAQIKVLNNELAALSSATQTAQSPLVLIASGLEKEAEKIKVQISSIRNGFDELNIGPIERDLKLNQLNAQLDATNAKLKDLKNISNGTSPIASIAPDVATDAEKKLQADLEAIRIQAGANQINFENELGLSLDAARNARNENITTLAFEKAITDADAAYQAEILKNESILKGQELRLANDLAFAKKEEQLRKASNDKALADIKAQQAGELALENAKQNAKNTLIGQGFTLAATLAKDGTRTQFLIQKAGALAEIAIADGKARALIPAQTALIPFPASLAAAASLNAYVTAQTALGAAIVGASAIKGFADGGIVGQGGATVGPDNRVATIRDGELILNGQQQKTLFDAINSGNLGGGDIVVQVDGKEIARAVRSQIQGGFRLA